ncbi:nucleotide exchange factor GrpE, partial [candidate division KSB1 bacterium]|nr:nucleotide exchange factor GrpE [candidate division KSB1 bacterium]
DVLAAAQAHLQDPALSLALREFEQAFADSEVEKIAPKKDSQFSEEVHEVVETVKGDKKNTIKEVVLSGWQFAGGTVIRPAKVKVVN